MVLMAWVTLDAGLQGETLGTEEGPGHSTGPAAVKEQVGRGHTLSLFTD